MAAAVNVALFDPCYLTTLRPMDAGHARRVLEALGDKVTLIDGRCCGQPAFNSGYRAEARQLAERFIDVFDESQYVVTPSGSCASMAVPSTSSSPR